MLAYSHTFNMLFMLSLVMIPLCLSMKIGKPGAKGEKPQMMIME